MRFERPWSLRIVRQLDAALVVFVDGNALLGVEAQHKHDDLEKDCLLHAMAQDEYSSSVVDCVALS